MTRLCLLSWTCFLLGVFPVAAATTPAGDSHPRPNIVFVVADDMGFKDTGYNGKRPGKRAMELIQMYLMGYADLRHYRTASG